MLSKQDKLLVVLLRLVKKFIGKYVMSRREKRQIHTLKIGGHVQMEKSDPKAQRKSSLSNCTWMKNEKGSFNLETLKFLMHFREPGSSFFLFLLILTFLFLFSLFSLSHFFFFSFLIFFFLIIFYCSP
jgi:hypothetical protein